MMQHNQQTFTRSFAGLFFVCVCLSLLMSCRSHQEDDAIRFGLASAPVTLDPRFSTDAISSRINRLIYRQLIDFDAASQPIPSLATWTKLTPKQFRFHLQSEYRTFHDGTRLTANDVKATFDSILDEKAAAPHRATLHMISSIEVVDDDTVDFYLNTTDPLFPGYLEIGILPAAQIKQGHSFNTQPIGSGPFRFLSWRTSDRLRLQRQADQQVFEFLHVKEENTRVLKLLRGELDMLQNDIDTELIKYLGEQVDVKVTTGRGSNFSYLGFNMQDPEVSKHSVRQAIAYAIDRESIIKYLFSGRARLASALLTPDHWAGHPELPTYNYNPEKARQLLKQSGYTAANPLRINYKTSSNPFRIRLATIIQSQLAAVGIDVDIQTYDWGTFYGDIKAGNFQMYSLAWVGINLPDIFRYVFHSQSVPPAGANRGRYTNLQIDTSLETAQKQQDITVQAKIFQEIQEILYLELPYVPLWYEDHVYIARKNVNGYRIHPDGNYDGLADVYLTDSQSRLVEKAR